MLLWNTHFCGSTLIFALLIPPLLSWELWLARNSARFKDEIVNLHKTCTKVKRWLHELNDFLKPKKISLPSYFSQILHIPTVPKRVKTPFLVKWYPPQHGCYKLNINGASAGNRGPAGCGGLLRDWKGKVIFRFYHFLGIGTNTLAEVSALKIGLQICYVLGIERVAIETDSNVAVHWFHHQANIPWSIRLIWEDSLDLAHIMSIDVSHIYREAN